MQKLYTPRQVAKALGVSEASLKRWCDKDLITSTRTAGGHRRLTPDAVVQFLRRSGHRPVRPELLGLPSGVGRGETVMAAAEDAVREALEVGDEDRFDRLVIDLYLAAHTLLEICDRIVAPALRSLGDRWQHGDIEVYQERRGCEIATRLLHRVGELIPRPAEDAPLAYGGTVSGDPYTLPTTMVEIVLRELGWRAESYGIDLPLETLRTAIEDRPPRLFWLSFSTADSTSDSLAAYDRLYEAASGMGVAVVVGGRALTDEVRSRMRYSAYCDNLRHLAAFSRTLYRRPERPAASAQEAPAPAKPDRPTV